MVVSSCEPPKNVFPIPTPNNEMRDYDPARVFDRFVRGGLAGNTQQRAAWEFSELRPLRASYRFGWSGVTAATGEVHFTKPSNDRFQLEGTGRTMGFVRALWKLDVTQRAVANSQTLAPIETQQSESYRSKKIATHLTFTDSEVTRARTEAKAPAPRQLRAILHCLTCSICTPRRFTSAVSPSNKGAFIASRFTRQQTLTWPL